MNTEEIDPLQEVINHNNDQYSKPNISLSQSCQQPLLAPQFTRESYRRGIVRKGSEFTAPNLRSTGYALDTISAFSTVTRRL